MIQERHNLRYSWEAGDRGTIDAYRPDDCDPGQSPLLLIHGGGWQALSKDRFGNLARWIAANHRIEVWCPNYRLLPGHSWPAPLEDCLAAARYVLKENGAAKLVVGGGSAGGHLAMLTGFQLPAARVQGILSYAGPAILKPRGRPLAPLFSKEKIDWLFGPASTGPDRLPELSPALHPVPAPPLALVHSRNDRLVPPVHALLMMQNYRRSGRPCRAFFFNGPGIHHGGWIPEIYPGSPPAPSPQIRGALHRSLDFLYLGPHNQ